MRNSYIAIAGVMGSGKTTIARLLAKELEYILVEEAVTENPFLERFYQNPKRWVLPSELFFLSSKIRSLVQIGEKIQKQSVIGDTPIEQDVYSYAKTQHDNGNMSDDEWQLYYDTYQSVAHLLPSVTGIIYLYASIDVIQKRIAQRNRPYEKDITKEDLQRLEENNHVWMKKKLTCPILTVSTDDKNYVDSDMDRDWLVATVRTFITNRIN